MSLKSVAENRALPSKLKQTLNALIMEKRFELLKLVDTFQKSSHVTPDDARLYERLLSTGPASLLAFVETIGTVFLHFTESDLMYKDLVAHLPFKPWPTVVSDSFDSAFHFKRLLNAFMSRALDKITNEHATWASLESRLESELQSILVELLLLDTVQKIGQQFEQDWAQGDKPELMFQAFTAMDSIFSQKSFLLQQVLPGKVKQAFEVMTFISGFVYTYREAIRGLVEKGGFAATVEPLLLFLLKAYAQACASTSLTEVKQRFREFFLLAQKAVLPKGLFSQQYVLEMIWAQKKSSQNLVPTVYFFLKNPHFGGKHVVALVLQSTGKATKVDIEYINKQPNAKAVATCLANLVRVNGQVSKVLFN